MKSTVVVQVDTDTMLWLISHLKVRGGAQDVADAKWAFDVLKKKFYGGESKGLKIYPALKSEKPR